VAAVLPTAPPLAAWEAYVPVGVAGLCLAVYACTLYPCIPGGDSGEFIWLAGHHGVAHPPGYPLYSILANLFAALPWGNLAVRINFLSALCAAAAAGVLAQLVLKLTRSSSAAIMAAGTFGFASVVWTTAVAAEVFALNNLLVALLLHQLLCLDQADSTLTRRRHAWLCCLWAGLGMSHHHIFVFIGLPSAVFALYRLRRVLDRVCILGGLGLLGVGLSPHLYLVWAARQAPEYAWANTASWSCLVDHLLRRDYGTWQLAHADLSYTTPLWMKGWLYLKNLAGQTWGLGAGLAFWGAALGWRRRSALAGTAVGPGAAEARRQRAFGRLIGAMWLVYVGVLLGLSNVRFDFPLYLGIAQRFWQQALLLAVLCLAQAWARLAARGSRTLWAGAAAGIVLLQLGLNWRQNDRHADTLFMEQAQAILRPLPANAGLLASGDHLLAALRYAQQAAACRPDVAVIDQFRLLRPWGVRQTRATYPSFVLPGAVWVPAAPKGTFNLQQLVAANLPHRRLFVVNGLRVPDSSLQPTYRLWPIGPVEEILPASQELPLAGWLAADAAANQLATEVQSKAQAYPADSWEQEMSRRYWQERHAMAAAIYQYAQRHGPAQALSTLQRAAELFEKIQEAPHAADPQLLKNLGATYQQMVRFDPTTEKKMRATWHQYLAEAPPGDPDLPLIRQLLQGS
jgi:hypothetical protein